MAQIAFWGWPEYLFFITILLFFIGGVKTPPIYAFISLLLLPVTLLSYIFLPLILNRYIFIPDDLLTLFKNISLAFLLTVAIKIILTIIIKVKSKTAKMEKKRYFLSGLMKVAELILLVIFSVWLLDYADIMLSKRFNSPYRFIEKHYLLLKVQQINPLTRINSLKRMKIIFYASSPEYIGKFQNQLFVRKTLQTDSLKALSENIADIPDQIKRKNFSFLQDDVFLNVLKDKNLFSRINDEKFYTSAKNVLPYEIIKNI